MHCPTQLFWDFDGTLYNSYPQVAECVRQALCDLGIGSVCEGQELMNLCKTTLSNAFQICADRSGNVDAKAIFERFQFYHTQVPSFPPYDGLTDCIRTLSDLGCKHYLYTHRNHSSIDQLTKDGLWEYFTDAVTSEAGFPDKPAPDALLYLMQKYKLSPDDCVMIGDRPIDLGSGRNAGMHTLLFDPDSFYPNEPADWQTHSMKEIKALLTENQ